MALSTSEFRGRFGFGAMRLPMRDGEPDFELCNLMFDRFLEAGLNYFDTAHVYLGGKSEIALRESLVKRHPRESFFLVDKLTHGTFRNPETIRRVFQEELDACGVEYFDLLLAHAVNSAHYDMYTRQGVFETAKEFVADGRARHFGISYHDGPELLERILTEHPEIEAVQLQINYEDWDSPSVRSREVYDVATAHGIPVIVMEPCKGGQLVDLPEAAQAALDAAPNPEELSNAGFALRFCATQPNVAMVLSGMNNMDQVEDNLHAMAGDPAPLTAEQLQALRNVHEAFASLGMIPCTACHYCTDGCPKRIMIPELFADLNTKRVFGGWNPGWYFSNVHTVDGHAKPSECIKCGRCERECPQGLPIRQLLTEVAAEFE